MEDSFGVKGEKPLFPLSQLPSPAHRSMAPPLVFVVGMAVLCMLAPEVLLAVCGLQATSTAPHMPLRMIGATVASIAPFYVYGMTSSSYRFLGVSVKDRLTYAAGSVMLASYFGCPPMVAAFGAVDLVGALVTTLQGGYAAAMREKHVVETAVRANKLAAPRAHRLGEGFDGFAVSPMVHGVALLVMGLFYMFKPAETADQVRPPLRRVSRRVA